MLFRSNLGRSDTNSATAYLPTAVTFLYDQNGNLRTNGTRIFEYDDENQLTRITEPTAWKSEFTYDGKMKMRISKDYTWQGGAWLQTNETRRVYDGMLVVQERDSLNLPRLTYTRGKDLSGSLAGAGGIGGLLALSDHSTLNSGSLPAFFYHSDGNGNVTCLTDTNQTVVARYLSDPYGNTLSATGSKSGQNCYRFSSKESHANSGMVYYGYRWYMPGLQRWLNRDPLAGRMPENNSLWTTILHVEVHQGANLYWPFRNGPLSHKDIDGRIVPIICVIIAGVLVCGCSKDPPPPDQFNCWNPDKVPKSPGMSRSAWCDLANGNCTDCCASKYFVTPPGGDNKDYDACVAYCQQKTTECKLR